MPTRPLPTSSSLGIGLRKAASAASMPRWHAFALMAVLVASGVGLGPARASTVSVEGLYDFRHATDPQDNPRNLPVIEVKVFLPQSFGSFLMKTEIDLNGTRHDVSQVYSELTQSLKLGSLTLGGLPLFARVGYSGGLGLFDDAHGGFYIPNAYTAGLGLPFEVVKAYCDISVSLRDTNLPRASYDPMLTLYAERHFFNDKLLIANSLEAWSTTREGGGEAAGSPRSGKIVSWELESEAWYKITQVLSVGTYIRTTRNVYGNDGRWLVYPSFGIRYAF